MIRNWFTHFDKFIKNIEFDVLIGPVIVPYYRTEIEIGIIFQLLKFLLIILLKQMTKGTFIKFLPLELQLL